MTPAKNRTARGQAPGRLDFLGGVADYSGSLVLQMPTRATTRVALTMEATPPAETPAITLTGGPEFLLPLSTLRGLLDDTASTARLRAELDAQQAPDWTRYVLGCLYLFCRETDWRPEGALRFEVESEVPISMGVSSSAALEVATLRALQNLTGHHFEGTQLARLAQRAENEVVGAPCGLMDQLASAHGAAGALLPILCRPDILSAPLPLPAGVLVAGWPSGVKHAVADAPYATARCAAFMGKKILEKHLNRRLEFLSELTPRQAQSVTQVQSMDESPLPSQLSGARFLNEHGNVEDALSVVEPQRDYPVRASTLFAIEENARCEQAAHLLQQITQSNRASTLRETGEFLYSSHAAYSAMGLGSPQTDAMVATIRARGSEAGFYGARVSGGGCGGTVVVLCEQSVLDQLQALAHGALIT